MSIFGPYSFGSAHEQPVSTMYGGGDAEAIFNTQLPEINESPDVARDEDVSLLQMLGFDPSKIVIDKDGRVNVGEEDKRKALGASLAALGAGLAAGAASGSWEGVAQGISGGISGATGAYETSLDKASDRKLKGEMAKLKIAHDTTGVQSAELTLKQAKEQDRANRELKRAINDGLKPYFSEIEQAVESMEPPSSVDLSDKKQINAWMLKKSIIKSKLMLARKSITSEADIAGGVAMLMEISNEIPGIEELNKNWMAKLDAESKARGQAAGQAVTNETRLGIAQSAGRKIEYDENGNVIFSTPDKALDRAKKGAETRLLDAQVDALNWYGAPGGGGSGRGGFNSGVEPGEVFRAGAKTADATNALGQSAMSVTNALGLIAEATPKLSLNAKQQAELDKMTDLQKLQAVANPEHFLNKALTSSQRNEIAKSLGVPATSVIEGKNAAQWASHYGHALSQRMDELSQFGVSVDKVTGKFSHDITNPTVIRTLAEDKLNEQMNAVSPDAPTSLAIIQGIESSIGKDLDEYISSVGRPDRAWRKLQMEDRKKYHELIIKVKQALASKPGGLASAATDTRIKEEIFNYIRSKQGG